MNKLAIDTSTNILSIALMHKNKIVAERMTNVNKDHSARLMPAIVHLMAEVNMTPDCLQMIIVGNGPGSYTGTRIGITVAKTLAWTLNIPIYTESSLRNLANNVRTEGAYVCPFYDARREAVFTGLYKVENGTLTTIKHERYVLMSEWLEQVNEVDEDIYFLSPNMATFIGMIRENIQNKAPVLPSEYHYPRPTNLLSVNESKDPIPVHSVKPNYLRITEAEANLLRKQQEEI